MRHYIERTQRDTTLADVPAIARGQLAETPHGPPHRLLILDTHLLSNMFWSRTLFGDCPDGWKPNCRRANTTSTCCSRPGAEWHADGQRCQPDLDDSSASTSNAVTGFGSIGSRSLKSQVTGPSANVRQLHGHERCWMA